MRVWLANSAGTTSSRHDSGLTHTRVVLLTYWAGSWTSVQHSPTCSPWFMFLGWQSTRRHSVLASHVITCSTLSWNSAGTGTWRRSSGFTQTFSQTSFVTGGTHSSRHEGGVTITFSLTVCVTAGTRT